MWLAFEDGQITRIDLYATCPSDFDSQMAVARLLAAAGATITITRPLRHYYEDGVYTELSDRIEIWWNLDPGSLLHGGTGVDGGSGPGRAGASCQARRRPANDRLLVLNRRGCSRCSTRPYTVTTIEVGDGGAAHDGELTFVVQPS